MAKITLKIEKTFEAKRLIVSAGVRYWEDSTVNGIEDTEGKLIPCRNEDRWCPIIDLDSGTIMNWERGKTAKIHYKVCDDGKYTLMDENQEVIRVIDSYVPDLLCIDDSGYGDYIIMNVNEFGRINNWKCYLNEFETETEE